MAEKLQLKNEIFGYLKVIRAGEIIRTKKGKRTIHTWVCKCCCGKIVTACVGQLRSGVTTHCGCQRLKRSIASGRKNSDGSPSRAYTAWSHMLCRCNNKKNKGYSNYGGRGIKVSREWHSFDAFFNDMGHPPKGSSLDRINNNGNYNKANCRWATVIQQANNVRRNIRVKYKKNGATVAEWARILKINSSTLRHRLHRGWTIERAFVTVVVPRNYSS